MKKSHLAIALTGVMTASAFTTVALAKGQGGHHKMMMKHEHMQERLKEADANNDGKVSKDEMIAYKTKKFEAADTNRDGRLTQDEAVAYHEAERERRRKERQAKMFGKLDANGDGTASLEEFLAGGPGSFEDMDRNGDGFLSEDDKPKMKRMKKFRD